MKTGAINAPTPAPIGVIPIKIPYIAGVAAVSPK